MKPVRIITALLLIGAAGLFIASRSCDRPDATHFGDRFTPEHIQRYLTRKLGLTTAQQDKLQHALQQRTTELAALRSKATAVEPVFTSFRTQIAMFLNDAQVEELLALMEERRKDWKRASSEIDCDNPQPKPERKVEQAMQDITATLSLSTETATQLRHALNAFFTEFHDIKSDIYPEFYALMDDVYLNLDWTLDETQRMALSEIRAKRQQHKCPADE